MSRLSLVDKKYLNDFGVGGQIKTKLGDLVDRSEAHAVGMINITATTVAGTYNLVDPLDGVSTITIPDNAVIYRAWVDVITTFTSATDAATIALQSEAADDLRSAIAISDAANPWDAGTKDTNVLGPTAVASTYVKLSADRLLKYVSAVESLTAGKALVFVEYHQSV